MASIFAGAFGSGEKNLDHSPEYCHSSADRPGADTGLQDAVLEHRRRGTGADRRPGSCSLHDLSGRKTSQCGSDHCLHGDCQRLVQAPSGDLIPAFFKAKWNTNETLSTLMMNYIATQLVAFFTILWEVPKGSGKIGIINQNTNAGWLPQLFGSKYLLSDLLRGCHRHRIYVYLPELQQTRL